MVLSGTSSYHTTTRPNPTAVNSDDAPTLAVQYGRIETSTRSKRMNAQSLISFSHEAFDAFCQDGLGHRRFTCLEAINEHPRS